MESTLDHPPMVGWLIRFGTTLFGNGSAGVRTPFVLLGVLTSGLMGVWTARATGSERAGAVAMVGVAVVPMFAIGHVFAAPDMPFWFAVALAGLCLDRGLHEGARWGWVGAGIAVALGLWSKLTMLMVPVCIFGLLMAVPRHRVWLRRPDPWIAAGLALLLWMPWLIWQHEQGWPTLRFHLVDRHGPSPGLSGLASVVGGQAGYVSPLLAGALVWGLVRRPVGSSRAWLLPLALAAPPLIFFTMSGLWTRALPHWAGAGWLAALVPGAACLAVRNRLCAAALGLAGVMTLFVHVQAVTPVLSLGRADPTHDLHGWAELGPGLSAMAGSADADACLPRMRGTRYQTASQAAVALGWEGPEVAPLERPLGLPAGAYVDPRERCGATLVVASDRFPLRGIRCPVVLEVPVQRGGVTVRELRVHRCAAGVLEMDPTAM